MKCIHLLVSGRVQGVFFRANVRNKAIELGLNGYAKNLEDGNVEIVAQGADNDVQHLVDFIKKGPGIAKVEGIDIIHKEPENFNSFNIS